jgi:hypothetical protein
MNAHEQQERTPDRPPVSDVSPWVGLVGLVTLVSVILFARSWPDICEFMGWPNERGRLSGPNAALAAMVLTGLALAAWSVLVEKVHRNPSTGIDWSRRRPVSELLDISITKLAGLWATWFIIGAFYLLFRWYWEGNYLFAMQVIGWAIVPMFVLSVPYMIWIDRVMVNPKDHCWHFGAMLVGREAWDGEQVKKHWRAWVIKGLFQRLHDRDSATRLCCSGRSQRRRYHPRPRTPWRDAVRAVVRDRRADRRSRLPAEPAPA